MVDARIAAAVALTQEMEAEKKKYETLCRLAYGDEVAVVTSVVDYHGLAIFVPSAQEELKEKGGEEFALSRLQQVIQESVTKMPIKIVSISSCGYETYGWCIKFTCKKDTYELVVPNVQHVNEHNYRDANCCKLYLGHCKSPCFVDYIKLSYDIGEVAEAFASYIKEN